MRRHPRGRLGSRLVARQLFQRPSCCHHLLTDHILHADSLVLHDDVHPLLQHTRSALASAPNRDAFVAVLRAAVVSSSIEGRDRVNSSMHAVRRRLRLSVSAARVLGCGVLTSGSFHTSDDDMLHGSASPSANGDEPLQLHVIAPAVMLSKFYKPISRRLYLATHEDWSSVFGHNPLFSRDASLAFAAPDFGVRDWHMLCMLAVTSMKIIDAPALDPRSRE